MEKRRAMSDSGRGEQMGESSLRAPLTALDLGLPRLRPSQTLRHGGGAARIQGLGPLETPPQSPQGV